MLQVQIFLVFIFFVSHGFGASILGIFSMPSISHQVVYRSLMLELNKLGHDITIITTDPIKDHNLTNYREIDASFFYKTWNEQMLGNKNELKMANSLPELLYIEFTRKISTGKTCHAFISLPEVQQLIKTNPKFDLLITEFGFIPCFYGFAKFSNYNHIGVVSFQTSPVVHSNYGNPVPASHIPDINFAYLDKLNFWQRLRTQIFQIFMWGLYAYIMRAHDVAARQYLGNDLPNLVSIERNVSVLLVNSHFTISFPRPIQPGFVEIGGPPFHLNGRQIKPLPKNKAVDLFSRLKERGKKMKWLTWAVFVFWGLVTTTFGANILVIVPTPSFSHQQFYWTYLTELHKRGHNLTVVTPNPLNQNKTNYREIDISYGYAFVKESLDLASESGKKTRVITELLLVIYWKIVTDLCEMYLSDPNVINIYKNNEKFDLFILEWGLMDCFYPFSKLSDEKMVGISSFELGAWSNFQLGSGVNPAVSPDLSLGYSDQMTFLQRLRSTLYFFLLNGFALALRWKELEIARRHFGPDVTCLLEKEKKVNLVMDNSHFSMSFPRAIGPNFVPLGGPAFHLTGRKLNPLPKDIQEFMDSAEHGIIYFSLGTNVKTSNIANKEEKILIESFKRMKQKVLWKWENENLNVGLKNVKKAKWFPQIEILAHPKVKAFVTQGGLQSIGEAIEYHVPMIVMPFFADQGHNAFKMESVGVAKVMDFDALTVESFTSALDEIIYNQTYKENMVKFSALVKDQPMPPLKRAIWWTEYVIRHNGAPHLRSMASKMPWYQYLNLDVICVVVAALLLALYAIYRILKIVFQIIWKLIAKSDDTKKSKKD